MAHFPRPYFPPRRKKKNKNLHLESLRRQHRRFEGSIFLNLIPMFFPRMGHRHDGLLFVRHVWERKRVADVCAMAPLTLFSYRCYLWEFVLWIGTLVRWFFSEFVRFLYGAFTAMRLWPRCVVRGAAYAHVWMF